MKQRKDKSQDAAEMFGEQSEEERYRRYKKICYRNLVIKSLLAFLLGVLFAGFLSFLEG